MSEIIDQYRVTTEPYYHPVADEVELYEAAYSVRMPMMLKGPTGCGVEIEETIDYGCL